MGTQEIKRQLYRFYSRIRGIKDDRYQLLKNLPKRGTAAEIGVWKGDFTARILSQTKPSNFFLIDPYRYYPQFDRAWFGGTRISQRDMDQVFMDLNKRFKRQIVKGKIKVIRKESIDAAHEFEDKQFDWIYLDGNHMYEFVLNDLETYFPKVKEGGILAGDDYNIEGWWKDGVTKAVKEFVKTHNAQIANHEIFGSQFLIQKGSA